MTLRIRRLGALVGALAALTISAPIATASSFEADRIALPLTSSAVAAATKSPCQDGVYSLIGGRWNKTVHWTFNAASTPANLTRAAAEARSSSTRSSTHHSWTLPAVSDSPQAFGCF